MRHFCRAYAAAVARTPANHFGIMVREWQPHELLGSRDTAALHTAHLVTLTKLLWTLLVRLAMLSSLTGTELLCISARRVVVRVCARWRTKLDAASIASRSATHGLWQQVRSRHRGGQRLRDTHLQSAIDAFEKHGAWTPTRTSWTQITSRKARSTSRSKWKTRQSGAANPCHQNGFTSKP